MGLRLLCLGLLVFHLAFGAVRRVGGGLDQLGWLRVRGQHAPVTAVRITNRTEMQDQRLPGDCHFRADCPLAGIAPEVFYQTTDNRLDVLWTQLA